MTGDGADTSDVLNSAGSDDSDGTANDAEVSGAVSSDDPSITDLAQQPVVKAWTTFVVALSGLVGAGIGLVMILGDVGGSMFTFSGSSGFGDVSIEIDMGPMGLPPEQAIFWVIPIAAFVGVSLGLALRTDDTTTFLVAAVSTFAGMAVLLVVSALFTTIAVDGISLDIGGLIVTTIVASLVTGGVAAGAVWIARNQAPDAIAVSVTR